jgi:hypothetical protein
MNRRDPRREKSPRELILKKRALKRSKIWFLTIRAKDRPTTKRKKESFTDAKFAVSAPTQLL